AAPRGGGRPGAAGSAGPHDRARHPRRRAAGRGRRPARGRGAAARRSTGRAGGGSRPRRPAPVACAAMADEPNPYRLPRNVIPRRYDLRLTPDLTAATFAGEVDIDVEVHDATATVVLNAIEL